MHLPHHGKTIALVAGLMLRVAARRWSEERQLQVDAVERNPVTEDIQRATLLDEAADV